MPDVLRPLPYAEFPLRVHRNGQWFKSVWNPRAKKSEQFYFGAWHDDPKDVPLEFYPAGTAGPEGADKLLWRSGRKWRSIA